MSKSIAIIPARGGSKRIPNKNIKRFLGEPIISFTIKAALESKLFDRVMVSTDDLEIQKIALEYGAEVPFLRSEKNADDHATTIEVIAEVIKEYQSIGENFDYACCIYPTAPFTTGERLVHFFNILTENDYDCVFPILEYSYPIQRALILNEDQRIEMVNPEYLETRSQDHEKRYHDAGQFYWFITERLISERKLWTDNTAGILINPMEAQDIDNLDDWRLAELKIGMNKEIGE
jgi:pseudaminic acid cytidylyltransferase